MSEAIRRSARLVIQDDEGRFLLFLYHDEFHAPFWATAGGELKTGETYRDAAERELAEETGIEAAIGKMVRERDDVYAVARSQPARWLEKYFLVRCSANSTVIKDGWTEEEQVTIRDWKWWSRSDLLSEEPVIFKPEWLASFLLSMQSDEAAS